MSLLDHYLSPQASAGLKAAKLIQRANLRGPKRPQISLLEWQWANRSWLKPGLAFDLHHHRYLKAIYEDTARDVVLCKSGQSGLSEYALSWSLWTCDVRGGTVLYLFPNDGLIGDFSSDRLGGAIDASEYLEKLVQPAQARGADRITLKRIRDRFLYLRGATVRADGRAPQLKSVAADAVVFDEFDEMDRRAEPLARQRLGHSAVGDVRLLSTPTFSGVGIHKAYLESNQQRWMLKCEHCGNWQTPEIEDVVDEWDELGRPVPPPFATGKQGGTEEPEVKCRKCKKPLDRTGEGEWVATYQNRDVQGYHISRLFSAQRPLSEIVVGLQSTDDSERQQVYNQALGLPYRSLNSVSLTDELLDACRREYAHGPRKGGAFCGIDVGRVLNVVIRGSDWGQRWAGQVKDFEEIEPLLRQYGVLVTVVDANPETRAARQFQARHGVGSVWLAYYVQGRESKAMEPWAWDMETLTVKADRTRVMDATLGQFRLAATDKARGATLPLNARDVPDYYAQMKAPERKTRDDRQGNRVAYYDESGPDHFAHAEAYAYMAAGFWLAAAENRSEVVYDPVRIADY